MDHYSKNQNNCEILHQIRAKFCLPDSISKSKYSADIALVNEDSRTNKYVTVNAGLARFIHRTLDLVVPKNLGCQKRSVTLSQILEVIDILSESEGSMTYRDLQWCKGKYLTPDDIFISLEHNRCKNTTKSGGFLNNFE